MIATEGLVEVDKKLYFKSRYIAGTFCYDLTDNVTRLISETGKDKPLFKLLDYYLAVEYKEYVVFPPFLGDKFTIYNTKNGEFIYLFKRQNCLYRSYAVVNQRLYLFTLDSSETTILEEENGKFYFTYLCDSVRDVKSIKINGCDCVGNYIVLASQSPNELVVYDTLQKRFDIVSINMGGMVAWTIHCIENSIWITGNQPVIYVIHEDLHTIIKTIELSEKYIGGNKLSWDMCFSMGEIVGKYIFYAPMNYRAVTRVNASTNEIETIMPIDDDKYSWGINYVSDNCMHLNLVKDEKEHWSYFINYDGEIIEEDVFKLSNWSGYWRENPFLQESKFISLKCLLTNE